MAAKKRARSRLTKLTKPLKVLSVENLAPVLLDKFGNYAECARVFKVTRAAVAKFVREHPELLDVVRDAKNANLDLAENSLMKAVRAGKAWAVKFMLETKGKRRGYVKRTEVTGADGEAIEADVTVYSTLTAADVAAARGLLGMAGGDVPANGHAQPVHPRSIPADPQLPATAVPSANGH